MHGTHHALRACLAAERASRPTLTSACAGALGLRLAGDAWYFGKLVTKPYIGDEIHPIEPQDIRRVNRLMYGAAGIMGLLALVMRTVSLF